jgi:hypothetical protein
MRIIVGLILLAHGFAHLVGFVVPWRLMAVPDAAYKTTLLAGKINVGDRGRARHAAAVVARGHPLPPLSSP